MNFEQIRDGLYTVFAIVLFAGLLVLDVKDGEISIGGGVVVIMLGGFLTGQARVIVKRLAGSHERDSDE